MYSSFSIFGTKFKRDISLWLVDVVHCFFSVRQVLFYLLMVFPTVFALCVHVVLSTHVILFAILFLVGALVLWSIISYF